MLVRWIEMPHTLASGRGLSQFKEMLWDSAPGAKVFEFHLGQCDIMDISVFVDAELRDKADAENLRFIMVHGYTTAERAVIDSFASQVLLREGVSDTVLVRMLGASMEEFEKYFPLECFLDSPSVQHQL